LIGVTFAAGDFDFFFAGAAKGFIFFVIIPGGMQKGGRGGWPVGNGEGSNVSMQPLLRMHSEHGSGLLAAIQSSQVISNGTLPYIWFRREM
jgi:hypothetical protein